MFTSTAGRRLSVLLAAIGLVAACATSPGSSPPASAPQAPTTPPSSPSSPTQTTTPPAPSPTPTAPPEVGLAWSLVDDPDLASYPETGMMHGVIAGGPGAIAWGETWGPPGANGGRPHLGPKIWTTANGRDWAPASVEPPSGSHATNPGAVIDIAAGGPGYVAVGSYYRTATRTLTAAVWTSTDGRTWRLNPEDPALARSLIQQLLPWQGRLLAVGCELVSAVDCGNTRLWTSADGRSWSATTPVLPDGIAQLGLVSPAASGLWAQASSDEGSPLLPDSPRPVWLTSSDASTWTKSQLPYLGGGRLHAVPAGLAFTAYEIPSGDPSVSGVPAWMDRAPGVYGSTDLKTWEPLAVGRQLGEEIVAVGDTLIMVGTTGTKCWLPGRCAAAAWRSDDAGQTWQAVPVTGAVPKDRRGATMRATAALPDGTLVAVGDLTGTDGMGDTAAWVAPAN